MLTGRFSNGLFLLAIGGSLLGVVPACQAHAPNPPPSPPAPAADQKVKLDHRIETVIAKLQADRLTESELRGRDLSHYSTPAVRVNGQGGIQVYLHLARSVGEEEQKQLRERGMVIQIHNAKAAVIQGWIPFFQVEAVAALEFVDRITPPDYGRLRTR